MKIDCEDNLKYLYGIVRGLFPVQAANSSLDNSGVFLNFENWRSRIFVNDVLLDGVLQLGVRPLFQVVIVDGRHGHDHHAGRTVLCHVSVVYTLLDKYLTLTSGRSYKQTSEIKSYIKGQKLDRVGRLKPEK